MSAHPSHVAGGHAELGMQGGNANHGLARKGTMGRVAAEHVAGSETSAARVRTGSGESSITLGLLDSGLASLTVTPQSVTYA